MDGPTLANPARREVRVRGVVQGVGFRPFVFRIALEEGLAGFIGNDTEGVLIEVEGLDHRIDRFLDRLRAERPPLARIDGIAVRALEPRGDTTFRIVASEVLGQVSTGIPADAATCPDCLRELFDPNDRRYLYPFLNCTNCGPRFTITRRIPYDRPQTSMAKFSMCPECEREYHDPLDRRFHAQPNACWTCGPRVWLEGPDGATVAAGEAIQHAIEQIMYGETLAIKGIGGFHLAVDATNESAVMRLRERKNRYGKPLAVMVRDLDAARRLCLLTDPEEALLVTPARPIVLARAREGNGIAPSVAPGIPWLGVYLPYAPLQHLLFADGRVQALVMTSANLSEEPIAIDNDEARMRLGAIADAFLMHDREILQRCDDSVTAVVDGSPQIVRRARGFVPLGIELPFEVPPLLAVGGHLKNAFALARGRHIYQSQHLGDLENLTGLDFFRESLVHLMRTFEIEPKTVVHDMHPGYLSTGWARQWAAERGLKLIAVQHHHAHLAGCITEHGFPPSGQTPGLAGPEGPVIGLALDGTGYGTDGTIWGGEVLLSTLAGFERFAHLEYAPMPGGEKAIREPWRMAYGTLHAAGIDDVEAAALAGATGSEARVLSRMMERGVNTPLTSSLGRLFDAVASIVFELREVDYEAQAAIELEGIAVDQPDNAPGYELGFVPGDRATRKPLLLKTASLLQALIADLRGGVPKAKISARFHAGVAHAFVQAATQARATTGINDVCLSGGCMHNRRLARLLRAGLQREGFAVYQHRNVSPGDGGLSYGQAAVAAARLRDQAAK